MKIEIELSRDEIKEIVKAHVLKEVPVHSASKDIFVRDTGYGSFKVGIDDKEVHTAVGR